MNAKIKTLFFALFLVVAATVNAQDAPKKYEFATVAQQFSGTLYISYAGKSVEKIKSVGAPDRHELLEYVENLQNEGWQVFSTAENQYEFTFVLRREKK